ncbi:MAG: virulence factor [Xanthomonadales bacterium]|nr:virulence factor [Xanthomonadales bacterium]
MIGGNVAREKIRVIAGGKGRGGNSGGSDSGSPKPDDWRQDLVRNRDGRIEATAWNITLILDNDTDVRGLFWLDKFANAVRLKHQPPWAGGNVDEYTDADSLELSVWLGSPHRYGLAAKKDMITDCVEAIARRHARHPVHDYLEGVQWDGTTRIERMFVDMFGAEDISYTRQAALCFMTSAVARILWQDLAVAYNGAKVDFMIVLEGMQDAGKSTVVHELFGAQWFAEVTESPAHKDFYQCLKGRWGVEISEMQAFSKADIGKIKQAITSRFDTYRASYGRIPRSFRRECVFVGTTNEDKYLRDPTGGRRFLPIKVTKVDFALVRQHRDQLWAEAVALYRDGYRWWDLPPDAAEQQEDRYEADSWEEVIRKWLDGKAGEKSYPTRLDPNLLIGPIPWVTTTEVLCWAIGIEVGKHSRPEQMRLATAMKRLQWRQDRVWADGNKVRRWMREQDTVSDDVPF